MSDAYYEDTAGEQEEQALEPFPEPIPLRDPAAGTMVELLAADASGGLLRYRGQELPEGPLTLEHALPGRDPVSFHVDVLGPALWDESCVEFQWMYITASHKRAHLVNALREILGLEAHLRSAKDTLKPGQQLVYDAEQQRVSVVRQQQPPAPEPPPAAAEPAAGEPWVWEGDWRDAFPSPAEAAPPSTTAQPEIEARPFPEPLPEYPSEPAPVQPPRPATPPQASPAAAPSRIERLRWAELTPLPTDVGISTTASVDEPAPPEAAHRDSPWLGSGGSLSKDELHALVGSRGPMFGVPEKAGTFTLGHRTEPMVLVAVGQAQARLAIRRPSTAPELGQVIRASIPADPLLEGLIQVSGPVDFVRHTSEGITIVDIVLRGRQSQVPREYRRVVQYWAIKSRGL